MTQSRLQMTYRAVCHVNVIWCQSFEKDTSLNLKPSIFTSCSIFFLFIFVAKTLPDYISTVSTCTIKLASKNTPLKITKVSISSHIAAPFLCACLSG